MKIVLKVPLSPLSGYGNDGIGLAQALIRAGADVLLEPTIVQAPLPPEVAQLLTKPLKPPFDLVINHVDPDMLEVNDSLAKVSSMNVGWTMWEYSNFENMKERDTLEERLENFDALIAYDDVTRGCFEQVTDKPLVTLQGGYNPEQWPYMAREWYGSPVASEDGWESASRELDGRFAFCMVGVLSERKDPFVAIAAFNELKHEYPEEFAKAELHLKTVSPGLHQGIEDYAPGVRIHYAVWPEEVLKAFYQKMHVLLAPSRGEGKNMPALEFQSTGGVVVATNWGGHQQWLDKSYSYPLDYTLHPVAGDLFPTTFNARASVEHLKEIMLHLIRNRDEARQKGELAAQMIPKLASWDNVVEKLFLRLKEVPGTGPELWSKYTSMVPLREDDDE